MTTVYINEKSRIGRKLLKDIGKHPRIAQIVDDLDNTPLPVPIEETFSMDEFREHFEKEIYERLGLKIDLREKYRGKMTKQSIEDVDNHLDELRNAWE